MMLTEMRTFVLFAEEGSIQRVAERLPLTQPAVSRQLQRLEQALGFELLDRRLKPPGLAPAGVEALARCRKVLAAYDELTRMARPREPEGMLRLGIAHGIAGADLAPIIHDLRRQFPRVMLRLLTGWSQPLAEQLARGQLDAAMLLSADIVADRVSILGKEQLSIIAAATALDDVRADEAGWVLSPEPCDARKSLAAMMSRQGRALQVIAEVQDSGLQLALVREGLGLSLLPRRILRKTEVAGIAVVEPDDIRLTLDVQLQRSPHLRQLDPVVDLFAEFVRAQLE